MNEEYKSIKEYQREFPDFPEKHYQTVADVIKRQGYFIQRTPALRSPESVMFRDLPQNRPVTENTIEMTRRWARRVRT